MGADIHIMMERKLKDGTWTLWNNFHRTSDKQIAHWDKAPEPFMLPRVQARHYEFFAALAGVRGPGPEPKGLPPDASPAARQFLNEDDPDLHSHTWWPADEFTRIFMQHHLSDAERADIVAKRLEGETEGDTLGRVFNQYISTDYVTSDPNDGDPYIGDFRFVMAFDN